MVRQLADCLEEEPVLSVSVLNVAEQKESSEAVMSSNPPLNIYRPSVRTSLHASTWDGVFATVFGCVTGGVLLTNFLLELGASSVEIGFLSSIPLFVNLLQPVGAYLADRTTSRHWYGMAVFGSSRLLWFILLLLIAWLGNSHTQHHQLMLWTLGVVLITHILNALGGASWFSWMAAIVPRRLRGRYFGIRNSAANLVNLICVPLMGFGVSAWRGGTIQGYGVVLAIGTIAGLLSLLFQFSIRDVNPQLQQLEGKGATSGESNGATPKWYQDTNYLIFLLYSSAWTFAVSLSAPFFNLYLLDNLHIDVSIVTLYGSLISGANLLMLVAWGKLADRIGNRPILVIVGILTAITPLFWLATGNNSVSLWVWLPLIHLLTGGTWAAMDLCGSNMQMSVSPTRSQAAYFAITAAIAGITGAIGTAMGGFLAQATWLGGLPGLFTLSAVLRLAALLPLLFVHEHQSQPLLKLWHEMKPKLRPSPGVFRKPEVLIPAESQAQPVTIQAFELANPPK